MALIILSANNASTVLAAGISSSATSLTVASGAGSEFPTPVSGTSFFKLTLIDAATESLTEIMHVTAVAGDVFTVVRGQEGTSARAWSVNDIVANMMTAGTLDFFAQLESPVFSGTPGTPTAAAGNSSNQLASTEFVTKAITALALGTASKRDVGTGTNQIPDMASFGSGAGVSSWWYRHPSGTIEQYGIVTGMTSGAITIQYPIQFPNEFRAIVVSTTSNVGANSYTVATNSLNPASGTKLTSFSVTGYNTTTSGASPSNNTTISNVIFYWRAVGA